MTGNGSVSISVYLWIVNAPDPSQTKSNKNIILFVSFFLKFSEFIDCEIQMFRRGAFLERKILKYRKIKSNAI